MTELDYASIKSAPCLKTWMKTHVASTSLISFMFSFDKITLQQTDNIEQLYV